MNRLIARGDECEAAGPFVAAVESKRADRRDQNVAVATSPMVSVLRPGWRAVLMAESFGSESDRCEGLFRPIARSRKRISPSSSASTVAPLAKKIPARDSPRSK